MTKEALFERNGGGGVKASKKLTDGAIHTIRVKDAVRSPPPVRECGRGTRHAHPKNKAFMKGNVNAGKSGGNKGKLWRVRKCTRPERFQM